VVDFLLVLIEL